MTDQAAARDGVEALLDPGSFTELDRVGKGVQAVVGHGTIGGRDVAVHCAVLDQAGAARVVKIQELALRSRIPIVAVHPPEASEADDSIAALAGRAEVLERQARSSGVIPQLAVVCGAPGPAAALCDFVLGPAGEDLVDLPATGVRDLLSFLPSHSGEAPPFALTIDPVERADSELQALVDGPYDMRELLVGLLDGGRFLELRPAAAPTLLVGFGRLGGHAVGIVANRPSVDGGVLDGGALTKAAAFIRRCDAFNVPLVSVVDAPERAAGSASDQARLLYAYAEASVPKLAVIARRASGAGYLLMSPRQLGADLSLAWPTARIGGADPYSAAERGYVDDVIEPRETRRLLVRGLELCRHKTVEPLPRKHGNIRL